MVESYSIKSQNLKIVDKIYARVRLATKPDANHIYKLFYQIHEFHNVTHIYNVTKDSLCNLLFESNPNPPFFSQTVLLLEVSPTEFPPPSPDDSGFVPVTKMFDLKEPLVDDEYEEFVSTATDHKAYVVGYAFFYPNYSSSEDSPGIFLEGFYFRASYRKLLFGQLLAYAIANTAATKGFSSIDGIVAVWNKDAYNFFVDMGGNFMDEYRYGTLNRKGLQAYANKGAINEMGRNGGIRAKM